MDDTDHPRARPARSLRLVCRLLLTLLSPLPALAWNGAGHRLVACIAWDQLAPAPRAAVSELLRQHPDHARWLRRAGASSADVDRAAFIEASTWPDDIRSDRRFYSAGIDPPTPTLPGFPDMERRRSWHGVSYLLPAAGDPTARRTPRGAALSGQLEQALSTLIQTLAAPGATPGQRSYALPWLIHLTADAHQPLHTSARINAQGAVEHGGNGLAINTPFIARKMATTLHAYWDDLPGPPWLRGERLDDACRTLAANDARPGAAPPAQWLAESWQIASESGYPPDADATPTLSGEFNEKARQIARQRIAQAGFRLADLLHELLGETRN